jgi:TolA-binding protein
MAYDETDKLGGPEPALVKLIHAQRGHMSTRQRVEGAQAFLARAMWNRDGVRLRTRWAAALALGVGVPVLAVALFAFERRGAGPLSYAIDGGHVERGGFIEAESARQPRVRFSDGSELLLSIATKASLRAVDHRGARISLAEGSAHVDVVHQPGARWFVDAGPFLIAVTGTAFTVGWNTADEQLDVHMERGTVEVSGPLSDGGILLRSGQHLIVRVRQRETLIRDLEDPVAPAAQPAALGTAPADPDPSPLAAPRRTSGARAGANSLAGASQGPANRDWSSELANGNFESIVRQAQDSGLEVCLAQATSSDLAALADAARYGRHDEIARRALLAQRRRFALSASAHDACFLLGRLEETEQNIPGAVEWYDRYLTETPSGTYASEALGRKMTLTQRLYTDERARLVAEEYLRRFPQGTYAARARALARAP